MKAKPISFSAPMVRALLAGTKTQTRRVSGLNEINKSPDEYEFRQMTVFEGEPHAVFKHIPTGNQVLVRVPYGDLLRVREAFRITSFEDDIGSNGFGFCNVGGRYLADDSSFSVALTTAESVKFAQWKKPLSGKPPMYMFASLSRLFLRVSEVRCERLQDISASDAVAEGIRQPKEWETWSDRHDILAYRELWESINKDGSWALNPHVWKISFTREP